MKRLGFGVAAAGLFMTSAVSIAQDTGGYPDMRGQWKGTAQAVVTGGGPHNRIDGTPGETRTHNQEFTPNMTRQEGPKFWGELVSKDEVTKKLGVFASDKQTTLFRRPSCEKVAPSGQFEIRRSSHVRRGVYPEDFSF